MTKRTDRKTILHLMCASLIMFVTFALTSCAGVKGAASATAALPSYKYVTFSDKNKGDKEMQEMLGTIQSALTTHLREVSNDEARELVATGERVLSPSISVRTRVQNGGKTFITVNLYDYGSQKLVDVLKSEGDGETIYEDQKLALDEIVNIIGRSF